LIYFSLAGFIAAGLLGRFLGNFGVCIITSSSIGMSTFIAAILYYEVGICADTVYLATTH